VVFALLKPLLLLISNVFYVKDALLTLVSFHTLLNIIGIVLFLPFLGLFEKFLQTRFKTSEPKGDTMFIKRVSAKVPEAALKAMEDELKQVYMLTRNFINDCLGIDKVQAKSNWKNNLYERCRPERKI
jgi:phosphate:Na+ symporter